MKGMDLQAGSPPPVGRSKRKWIVIATVIVALVVLVAGLAVWLTSPATPLWVSVSLSPESPGPGEAFSVIADVEGGNGGPFRSVDVSIQYIAYFNGSGGGGGTPPHSGTRWQADIEGLPDGTEVWIMVAAATAGQPPVFVDRVVRIGTVATGGPSGLAITDLARDPAQPGPLDTIRLSARITSSVNVTDVSVPCFTYLWEFSGIGTSSSSGTCGSLLSAETPGNYTGTLGDFMAPGGGGHERGRIYIYRVAAIDAAWDTAETSAETFTIA